MPGGDGQRHLCVLHEWRRHRKLAGLCRQRPQMDQVRAPKSQLDHGSRNAGRREQLHLRRHARHVLFSPGGERGRHCRRHRDSRVRHVAIAATTSTLALTAAAESLTAAAESLSASIATAVAATLTCNLQVYCGQRRSCCLFQRGRYHSFCDWHFIKLASGKAGILCCSKRPRCCTCRFRPRLWITQLWSICANAVC